MRARKLLRAKDKDGFVFAVKGPRYKISKEQMLEGLRQFSARRGGRPFTMTEYTKWDGRVGGACTIANRFGCWSNAMQAAGLRARRMPRVKPEELVRAYESVWRKLGHRPTFAAIRRITGIGSYPFKRHWGTMAQVCGRFVEYKAGRISRRALLTPIKREPGQRLRPSVRWAVIKRDGHKCVVCGARAADGAKLEVDHIVAKCRGGGDEESNLRTLCERCNRGKGGE